MEILLRENLLRKIYFLSKKKKKKTNGSNPRGNSESKAIQTKSHPESFTYILTKKGKGEKLIYLAPKVHLLNFG